MGDDVAMGALYDRLGVGYTRVRGEDPRIAAAIRAALGDARTVVNVGAGTGSYEPKDREVVAVEPSDVMIAQRPPGSAPVVRGTAEALPFPDDHFDAAMTVLSDHHWPDRAAGLREMRRVARRRAVILGFDTRALLDFWLSREYLLTWRPEGDSTADLEEHFGLARSEVVPIPHDCRDGFLSAYWRRPHAYLDPEVRAGISVFRLLPEADVAEAMARLRADLESGEWERRHADLFDVGELDLGYRIWIADYD
jgi:SAM-dependent methyltransferase